MVMYKTIASPLLMLRFHTLMLRHHYVQIQLIDLYLDSKVHGANMGPTWALSAPDGPHVGPMNLAIMVSTVVLCLVYSCWFPIGHNIVILYIQGSSNLPSVKTPGLPTFNSLRPSDAHMCQ